MTTVRSGVRCAAAAAASRSQKEMDGFANGRKWTLLSLSLSLSVCLLERASEYWLQEAAGHCPERAALSLPLVSFVFLPSHRCCLLLLPLLAS